MFWRKKTAYLEWDQYADIVETWDTILFSQQTRAKNIQNMPACGERGTF